MKTYSNTLSELIMDAVNIMYESSDIDTNIGGTDFEFSVRVPYSDIEKGVNTFLDSIHHRSVKRGKVFNIKVIEVELLASTKTEMISIIAYGQELLVDKARDVKRVVCSVLTYTHKGWGADIEVSI
jgi:hypothetical protein